MRVDAVRGEPVARGQRVAHRRQIGKPAEEDAPKLALPAIEEVVERDGDGVARRLGIRGGAIGRVAIEEGPQGVNRRSQLRERGVGRRERPHQRQERRELRIELDEIGSRHRAPLVCTAPTAAASDDRNPEAVPRTGVRALR